MSNKNKSEIIDSQFNVGDSSNEENVLSEDLSKNIESRNQNKSKLKKTLKIVGETIFWLLIVILIANFVVNTIDVKNNYNLPIFGYRQSVIVSESMSNINEANSYYLEDKNYEVNRIQKFDVILTKKYKSFDDIKIYDVITYVSGSELICHRVLDKYESGNKYFVVTRGDANSVDDAPIDFSLVRGKVVSVTPKAGKFLLFIRSPYFLIAIFGTGFFVFLGLFIFDLEKNKKSKTLGKQENSKITDSTDSSKKQMVENNEKK